MIVLDAADFEKKYWDTGSNPAWLAKFVREYPAAFHLSWVKHELAKWLSLGRFDDLKKLQPGRGQRVIDAGLYQVFIDYLIHRAVTELLSQGRTLTGNRSEAGAFEALEGVSFNGVALSEGQIRLRYYRFIKRPVARFSDHGRLIVGPTKIEIMGNTFIGFWDAEIVEMIE